MTEREEKVWLKLINTTHKITKLMTPLIIKSMTPPTINWVSLSKLVKEQK